MANVPLVFDGTSQSIITLVDLLDSLYRLYSSKKANVMDKAMMLSTLGILTTNLSMFIRSMNQSDYVMICDEACRERLKFVIIGIIKNPQIDEAGVNISQSTLRLFIAGLEVLYPTESERCALLTKYLNSFADGSLTDLERSVLELLMRRLSSFSALSQTVTRADGRKSSSVNPNELFASLLLIAKR